MDILIRLSPDDVTDALREYLATRGFAYVSHDFVDGEVHAQVTHAPVQPPVPPLMPVGVLLTHSAPIAPMSAPSMEDMVRVVEAAQRGEIFDPNAVEETPALSLSELKSVSGGDLGDGQTKIESPTRKENTRKPASAPQARMPAPSPSVLASEEDVGVDELALALKAQSKPTRGRA